MPDRILILGGGPTGLGAALRLERLDHERFELFEREREPGGLARSFVDQQGFTWDIGGHVQFSHYELFDEVMELALPEQWLNHQRESWVWMKGGFVPYPFQNNLRHLPKEVMWECLSGLMDAASEPPAAPKNFGEWIVQTCGRGIAEHFMFPYNFKVWAHPPEEMDYKWIGERVAVPDAKRAARNILFGLDDVSWGPNDTFQFPKAGGTGAVWKGVSKLLCQERLHLGVTCEAIDPRARVARFSNGSEVQYDHLISTLPIPEIIRIAGLSKLQPAASRLPFSSSNIVGIGLAGTPPPQLATKCWMYFPEDDCPFYRVTVFSNYSPRNVPAGGPYWSLMAEVSESKHRSVDQGTLIEQTVQGMVNTGLIDDPSQVVSRWSFRAPYGYPTPGIERDDLLQEIQPALEAHGIFSRGRFGAWKYEVSNQDHSFMQGVEVVDRLLLGVPEMTHRFPNTVNDRRFAKKVRP
ncbi:MAG TPA: FAD-dependent oxidoreductase [Fimbriimonadaceae bacterium]|nr:FAD-dependent oxidoreductase [Fimbriimonadaceae bacterium]